MAPIFPFDFSFRRALSGPVLVLAVSLFLTGCSGQEAGEGSEAPAAQGSLAGGGTAAAPPPAAEPDTRKVIVAVGNSITAGFGLDPGNSYVDFLQKALDERGYPYRVVNAGLSGDTTGGGLARFESVLRLEPAVVILELGGNDGLRGVPVATMKNNLDQMIRKAKQAGAQVVLTGMTLPANYGAPYVQAFENMYVELAREHDIVLVQLIKGGVGEFARYLQADGIHPTMEGQRRLASIIFEGMQSVFRKGA